jgi:hypothetical protein
VAATRSAAPASAAARASRSSSRRSDLRHPNIVDTFDWGTDRQGRYIALEFVAGDSVLNLLKAVRSRGEQMPIDVVLYVIGKTAEGLHAAHELRNERGELRHLVHRDVTPSNVLVGRDGNVKLIDFGVAKARERLQNNTATSTLKGKFGYMSPEQARGVKNLDRRSDLWSLGVVLWECLAGRRLFKSDSELEILRMVTEETPASVRSVRPDVPEAVDSLLAGVFAKNRDDRLGSCAEFADYLWAVFREEGFTTDQAKVAEYFRKSLPDRCAALDRLVAGEDWHLEPTSAGPGSGSFNGTDAHSGVAPMQHRPVPMGATGGFSAASPLPVGHAVRRRAARARQEQEPRDHHRRRRRRARLPRQRRRARVEGALGRAHPSSRQSATCVGRKQRADRDTIAAASQHRRQPCDAARAGRAGNGRRSRWREQRCSRAQRAQRTQHACALDDRAHRARDRRRRDRAGTDRRRAARCRHATRCRHAARYKHATRYKHTARCRHATDQ